MNYSMEELTAAAGRLADRYTSYESTSVTYEKAEQLMEAVLYCIEEAERENALLPAAAQGLSAWQAYQAGAALTKERAGQALTWYNELLPVFLCCENRCLYRTFIQDLPEFFKWCDVSFAPQNTVVTLDYPVLSDLSAYAGVRKIYEYIRCIRLEQNFLLSGPNPQVLSALSSYHEANRDMIENLCEIVLLSLSKYFLAEKPFDEATWEAADSLRLTACLSQTEPADLLNRLQHMTGQICTRFLKPEDREDLPGLQAYLTGALPGLILRLKHTAE